MRRLRLWRSIMAGECGKILKYRDLWEISARRCLFFARFAHRPLWRCWRLLVVVVAAAASNCAASASLCLALACARSFCSARLVRFHRACRPICALPELVLASLCEWSRRRCCCCRERALRSLSPFPHHNHRHRFAAAPFAARHHCRRRLSPLREHTTVALCEFALVCVRAARARGSARLQPFAGFTLRSVCPCVRLQLFANLRKIPSTQPSRAHRPQQASQPPERMRRIPPTRTIQSTTTKVASACLSSLSIIILLVVVDLATAAFVPRQHTHTHTLVRSHSQFNGLCHGAAGLPTRARRGSSPSSSCCPAAVPFVVGGGHDEDDATTVAPIVPVPIPVVNCQVCIFIIVFTSDG